MADRLFTPALTRVSLVAAGSPTDYVDSLLELVAPDGPARTAFDLYCAVFCLDLISEDGVTFNREQPVVVERDRMARLADLASQLTTT